MTKIAKKQESKMCITPKSLFWAKNWAKSIAYFGSKN